MWRSVGTRADEEDDAEKSCSDGEKRNRRRCTRRERANQDHRLFSRMRNTTRRFNSLFLALMFGLMGLS